MQKSKASGRLFGDFMNGISAKYEQIKSDDLSALFHEFSEKYNFF